MHGYRQQTWIFDNVSTYIVTCPHKLCVQACARRWRCYRWPHASVIIAWDYATNQCSARRHCRCMIHVGVEIPWDCPVVPIDVCCRVWYNLLILSWLNWSQTNLGTLCIASGTEVTALQHSVGRTAWHLRGSLCEGLWETVRILYGMYISKIMFSAPVVTVLFSTNVLVPCVAGKDVSMA